jgi:cytoskeletal protein CcmA (bactofilin family)
MFVQSDLTMSALPGFDDSQEVVVLDQTADSLFDPRPHFGKWLQAVERFHNRAELCPGVYLESGNRDFSDTLGIDGPFPDQCSDGALVVTEQGELEANVEVTVAVIDGLFKGKITATEHVVLENHAFVIGEINTPALTVLGGAIIEGRCYFEPREQEVRLERWERPGWQLLKVGFAKVWRRRIFQ